MHELDRVWAVTRRRNHPHRRAGITRNLRLEMLSYVVRSRRCKALYKNVKTDVKAESIVQAELACRKNYLAFFR
jgi:hypothetical protein